MVEMTVTQPVFADSKEHAINIAKNDSWFEIDSHYEAEEMSTAWGIPTYLSGCLVFHDGDDDLTIEEAFAIQENESDTRERDFR